FESPFAGVKIHIHANPRRTITRQSKNLSFGSGIHRIKPSAQQHFLAVKRPAFDKDSVAMLPPDFVGQMVGDRELHEMSGNSFMAKDRSRIFNRRPDIKVL